jgi:hypothetical protein
MKRLLRDCRRHAAPWTAWALVLLISLAPVLAPPVLVAQANQIPPKVTDPDDDKPRDTKTKGSGGGGTPVPPNGTTPVPPTLTDRGSNNPFQLLLVVQVDGQTANDGGYEVVVTKTAGPSVGPPPPRSQQPSEPVSFSGITDKHGFVLLKVPKGVLELEVLGTSVSGMKVYGGQVVSIVLP